MGENEDKKLSELIESAMLEAPPDDIARRVTPWRRAMVEIVLGLLLTTITFGRGFLYYVLTFAGVLLLLGGFRTLRRVNAGFAWCFRLTLLNTACVVIPRVRYLSLPNDFFPLFLLLGVVIAGIAMRYFFRVDIEGVKEVAMGLVTLHPVVIAGIGSIFYVHLFLASVLIGYFPWSKLMHAGGIVLSPTRNQANDSRAVRHVNPWNPDLPVHTYAEYEDEFKDKLVKAGLPLDAE